MVLVKTRPPGPLPRPSGLCPHSFQSRCQRRTNSQIPSSPLSQCTQIKYLASPCCDQDEVGLPDELGPPDELGGPDELGAPDEIGLPDELGPPDDLDELGLPDEATVNDSATSNLTVTKREECIAEIFKLLRPIAHP